MTGGGTLGSVTPLLAVARECLRLESKTQIHWIGTQTGPERALIEAMRIPFTSIDAPKFNRHAPLTWIFIPFLLLLSCIESLIYLRRNRPDMVFTCGGYVSVPVVLMAWSLQIPVWVHQLDILPGLANRIMAPFAKAVSVTWPESVEYFSKKKTKVVGGVFREMILHGNKEQACETYGLSPDKKTILVIGGGTGAQSLNEVFEIIGKDLLHFCQVVHVTGKGKMTRALTELGRDYIAIEFLGEGIADVLALADIVVSRAGMGTICELSALKKPVVIVPLSNIDQLGNARALEQKKATEVLWDMNPQILTQTVVKLLADQSKQKEFGRRIGLLFNSRGALWIAESALDIEHNENTRD